MTTPTPPTMSDERLDRLVRQLLAERAEDVAVATVSADAMAERIASRLRPSPVARVWVLLAATAILAALMIGGGLVVGGVLRLTLAPVPAIPTPGRLVNARPWLQLHAPSARDGLDVLGWPDTSENRAGLYSWDGSRCASTYCTMGFMHNGYGSGNVEIRVEDLLYSAIPSGATAVTVAGHDGVYRRIDALHEEWIVDIGARTIAIRLAAKPGTSQADVDDAYSIIGPVRTEAQPGSPPFRLVFTLTTDDWDSG